jgi:hypothetical protein
MPLTILDPLSGQKVTILTGHTPTLRIVALSAPAFTPRKERNDHSMTGTRNT